MRLFPTLFGLLLILSVSLNGQNLVPNPGFETFTTCPSTSCQWDFAADWGNVNGTTGCNNGNSGSPDYFHTCGTGFFGFPVTLNGEVNPLAGNAVMGLGTWLSFSNNFREYISVPLTAPLVPGDSYTLSFSVTNGLSNPSAAYGGFGTELGVHLSVGALTQNGTNPIILTPTYETPGIIFSTNWVTVTVNFVATNAATHLTIGNFRNDANTTISQVSTPSGSGYAYYFLDEISVEPVNPLPLTLLSFNAWENLQSNVLRWEAIDIPGGSTFLLERSDQGEPFREIGRVLPQTGQTIFEMIDGGLSQQLTVYRLSTISQGGTKKVLKHLELKHDADALWRIDQQENTLSFTAKDPASPPASIEVIDLNGRIVATGLLENGYATISTDSWGAGVYVLMVSNGRQIIREKLVIR